LESNVQLSPLPPHSQSSSASHPLDNTATPSLIRQQNASLLDSFEEITEEEMENESHRLLTINDNNTQTSLPRNSSSNRRSHQSNQHPATLPVTNDGVFANMSAKPESESAKEDETPPVSPGKFSPIVISTTLNIKAFLLTIVYRRTKKLQLIQHRRTGKLQS
jgi:hypothetical protein